MRLYGREYTSYVYTCACEYECIRVYVLSACTRVHVLVIAYKNMRAYCNYIPGGVILLDMWRIEHHELKILPQYVASSRRYHFTGFFLHTMAKPTRGVSLVAYTDTCARAKICKHLPPNDTLCMTSATQIRVFVL